MKSMTGFGKAQVQTSDLSLHINIKCVNSRFLDFRPHLPRAYQSLEMEIKKRVAGSILRGTVDVSIHRTANSVAGQVVFNQALAKEWLQGFEKAAKKLGLETSKEASLLFQVPDLFRIEEPTQISAAEKKLLWQGLSEALKQLDKSRAQEGLSLKKAVEIQLKSLNKELQAIEKLAKNVKVEIMERLQSRLELLRKDVDVELDPHRLMLEVALQADKSDITEEVTRLKAHLQAIGAILKERGSVGKRLDFFAQELLREVNTMGSKSGNAHLTERVVQAKSFIEKYREQVQNIE